jgi:hypothetical protein
MGWKAKLRLALAFFAFTHLLSGCTLLGAGIGAGVDSALPGPYETAPPVRHRHIRYQDRVLVEQRDGRLTEGRYLGLRGSTATDPETYFLVEVDDRVEHVPMSDVRSVGVEVTGKGWLYGTLIGAAVDVAVVVAVIIAVRNLSYANYDGVLGCFC